MAELVNWEEMGVVYLFGLDKAGFEGLTILLIISRNQKFNFLLDLCRVVW